MVKAYGAKSIKFLSILLALGCFNLSITSAANTVTCNGNRSQVGYSHYYDCYIGCDYGGNGTVSWAAYDVPNRFNMGGNNSSWVGYSSDSGPWGTSISTQNVGSFSFNSSSSIGSLDVETVVPSYQNDARYARVDYTCNPATNNCQKPENTIRYSCQNNNVYISRFNDDANVCNRTTPSLDQPCQYGCTNGACNGPSACGTPNGQLERQCNGNVRQERNFINGNGQCTRGGWSDVESCPSGCENGYCKSHTKYTCQPAGFWQTDGVCNNGYQGYNVYAQYIAGEWVCMPSGTPGNNCQATAQPQQGQCNNSYPGGCNVGSAINDNNNNSCAQQRTWQCSGVNGGGASDGCEYNNAPCSCNAPGNTTEHQCEGLNTLKTRYFDSGPSCGRGGRSYTSCNAGCQGNSPNASCNSCVWNNGQQCQSNQNNCGDTNRGVVQCNGNCSAGQPGDRSCPVCVPNQGQSCSSPTNNCSESNQGSIQCNGSCDASTPNNRPNVGGGCESNANNCGDKNQGSIQCNGSCSANQPADRSCQTCVGNQGQSCTSSANNCSETSQGSIQCNGTCSAQTPANKANVGESCQSGSNNCGDRNQGSIQCNGSCSASTPADKSNCGGCVSNQGQACTSAGNNCGQTSAGMVQCNGTCSAQTPANKPNVGQSCNSPENNCKESNLGTVQCDNSCSASAPANKSNCGGCSVNMGSACQSPSNSCGMRNNGTIDCNNNCSATQAPSENLCVVPPRCGDGIVNQTWEMCDKGDALNSNTCSKPQCGSCGGCNTACQEYTSTDNSLNGGKRDFACIGAQTYGFRQMLNCQDGYNTANCPNGQQCDTAPNRNESNICKSCPAAGQKSNYRCEGNSIAYSETDANCGSNNVSTPCPYQFRCDANGGNPVCKCDAMIEVGLRICNKALASCTTNDRQDGKFQTFQLYNSSNSLIDTQVDQGYKVKFRNVVAGQTYFVKITDLDATRQPGTHFLQRDYSANPISSVTNRGRDMQVVAGTCVTDTKMQFYCSNPPCASKVKLVVDAGRDTNGNGQLDNGENTGIPGVINVYQKQGASWILYQSSRVNTGGNGCARDPNVDGSQPPYAPGFISQGCQGTTIDPISVDGGKQYRVTVTPEMGYQAKSKFLYQSNNSSHNYVSLSDTSSSSTKNTVEFTAPAAENIVVVFGHMGEDKDIGLTTTIASPKGGYYSGDIIQVNYKAFNAGYGTIDKIEVTAAIIDGLELLPNAPIFAGNCPTNGFPVSPPTKRPWRAKDTNGNIIYNDISSWHDFNNCSLTRSEWEENSCKVPFLNSMLFTWRSVRSNGGACPTPYFETRIKSSDPFPSSNSNLYLGAGPSSNGGNSQNDEQCFWYPNQGYSVQFQNGGQGGQGLANGQYCQVTLSYRVTKDIIGSKIRSRSCAAPTDTETNIFNSQNPNYEPVRNNCDELNLTIGLPYTRYRCDSEFGAREVIDSDKYTINGSIYNESAGVNYYTHDQLVSRLTVMGALNTPTNNLKCTKYPKVDGVCSPNTSYDCASGSVLNPSESTKSRQCKGYYGGVTVSCSLYNYFTCNAQGAWSRIGLDQLGTGGFDLYNGSIGLDGYKPGKVVYTNANITTLDSLTCAAAIDGKCGVTVGTCSPGTVTGDNMASACSATRTRTCQGINSGKDIACEKTNPLCAQCLTNGLCANGVSSADNNLNACSQTRRWTCTNPQGIAQACATPNGSCATCGSAGTCSIGSVVSGSDNNNTVCGSTRNRTCQNVGLSQTFTTSCSVPTQVCPPVAGVCNSQTAYACQSPFAIANINTTTKSRQCLGTDNGATANCYLYKNIQCNNGAWTTIATGLVTTPQLAYDANAPVNFYSRGDIRSLREQDNPAAATCRGAGTNGVCSTTIQYQCAPGGGSVTGSNSTTKTWKCQGTLGGSDASCSLYNQYRCDGAANPDNTSYGTWVIVPPLGQLTGKNNLYNPSAPNNYYSSGDIRYMSGALTGGPKLETCALFVANNASCSSSLPAYQCPAGGVVGSVNTTYKYWRCESSNGGLGTWCYVYTDYECIPVNDGNGSGYWKPLGTSTRNLPTYEVATSSANKLSVGKYNAGTIFATNGDKISFRSDPADTMSDPNQQLVVGSNNFCHSPINGICNTSSPGSCSKGTLSYTSGSPVWTCAGQYGGSSISSCSAYQNYECNGNSNWNLIGGYQATQQYNIYNPTIGTGNYASGAKVSVSWNSPSINLTKSTCTNVPIIINTGDARCSTDYQGQCQNGTASSQDANGSRTCSAPNGTTDICRLYDRYYCDGTLGTWKPETINAQNNLLPLNQIYSYGSWKYINGDKIAVFHGSTPDNNACRPNARNGVCAGYNDGKCSVGTYSGGSLYGLWTCVGLYSGSNASCIAYNEFRCDIGYWTRTANYVASSSQPRYNISAPAGTYVGGQYVYSTGGITPDNSTCQGTIEFGECGSSLNTCKSGTLSALNTGNLSRSCVGINGGSTASCRAYNGYNCDGNGVGTWTRLWTNLTDTGGYVLYNPSIGTNGYPATTSNVYTYASDSAPNNLTCKGFSYNGVCSTTVGFSCNVGTMINDSAYYKRWECQGVNGGNTTSCTYVKDYTCDGNNGNWVALSADKLIPGYTLYNTGVATDGYVGGNNVSSRSDTVPSDTTCKENSKAGVCGTSYVGHCTSAASSTNTNYSAETRTCPGSNGGANTACARYHNWYCNETNGNWDKLTSSTLGTANFAIYNTSATTDSYMYGQTVSASGNIVPNNTTCQQGVVINGSCSTTTPFVCVTGVSSNANANKRDCVGQNGGTTSACNLYGSYTCDGQNATWTTISSNSLTHTGIVFNTSAGYGEYSGGWTVYTTATYGKPADYYCKKTPPLPTVACRPSAGVARCWDGNETGDNLNAQCNQANLPVGSRLDYKRRWKCQASNGFQTVSVDCSYDNSECNVNGVCGATKNTCAVGTVDPWYDDKCDGNAAWFCNGYGYGSDPYCSFTNPACIWDNFQCNGVNGTWNQLTQDTTVKAGDEYYLWKGVGYYVDKDIVSVKDANPRPENPSCNVINYYTYRCQDNGVFTLINSSPTNPVGGSILYDRNAVASTYLAGTNVYTLSSESPEYYNAYYDQCDSKDRLMIINPWLDTDNNGTSSCDVWSSSTSTECGLVGSTVNIYDVNGILKSSTLVKSSGSYPSNGWTNQYPIYYYKNTKGAVQVYLSGNTTYKIEIVPPVGYVGATTNSHLLGGTAMFGSTYYHQNYTGSILTPLSYMITTPSKGSIMARTRLVSLNNDMKIAVTQTGTIKSAYTIGDTITLRYVLTNNGILNTIPSFETSIINGMVATGPAIVQGSCPTYIGSTYQYSSVTSADRMNTIYNCGSGANSGNIYCHTAYVNGILTTWNTAGVLDTTLFPADKYPFYNADITPWSAGSTTRQVPKGMITTYKNTSGPAMAAGSTCTITQNYVVTSTPSDNTIRTRTCVIPEASERSTAGLLTNNCQSMNFSTNNSGCAVPPSLGVPGNKLLEGQRVWAWQDDVITPSEGGSCVGMRRTCTSGVLSGSGTSSTCSTQCVTPRGSGINADDSTFLGYSGTTASFPGCSCDSQVFTCRAEDQYTAPSVPFWQQGTISPGYIGTYTSPACTVPTQCLLSCQNQQQALYEINYGLKGNTSLEKTKIVDQVHSNTCLLLSTFTGMIASNEVHISFYNSDKTPIAGFQNITGSTLSQTNSTVRLCGPYVEYTFDKPLLPGAKGSFFYQYELKENLQENPLAGTGDNCVWIYREQNRNSVANIALRADIDAGDLADRFLSGVLYDIFPVNAFNKFDPINQLFNNNKICVAPPVLVCTPFAAIKENLGVSVCGDGILQVGEECDEGTLLNSTTNYYNHDLNPDGSDPGPMYLEDTYGPLVGKSCSTSCKINGGMPQSCYFELPPCNTSSIQSIQEGEIYPFWWNISDPNSNQVASTCNMANIGKIMRDDVIYKPQCKFGIYNGLGGQNLSDAVYSGFVDCFQQNPILKEKPIFRTTDSPLIPGELSLINVAGSTNQQYYTTPKGGDNMISITGTLAGIDTLTNFKNKMVGSQGWYAILMSGFTQGKLGEYRIRMDGIEYDYCDGKEFRDSDGNLLQIIPTVISKKITQPICQQNLVLTKPYLIQESSSLSTVSNETFADYFVFIDNMNNRTLTRVYGTGVLTDVTKVGSYIPLLKGQKFVDQILIKYIKLASAGVTKQYTENFDGITGIPAKITMFKQIPNRQIYIYTGSDPVYISKLGLNAFVGNSNESVTIVVPNANVFIYRSIDTRNIFIITEKDIGFLGSNIDVGSQKISGILLSSGYVAPQLKNNDEETRWIDDGRLTIEGILMSNDVQSLVTRRRSVIKGWYNQEGYNGAQKYKRNLLAEGAAVQIVTNVGIFTSPPPLSQELFETLQLSK